MVRAGALAAFVLYGEHRRGGGVIIGGELFRAATARLESLAIFPSASTGPPAPAVFGDVWKRCVPV